MRSTSEIEKDNLPQSICYKNCWPNEYRKGKGEPANDFPQKLKTAVQFMKYASVIREVNGAYEIGHLQGELPVDPPSWSNILGFDPHHDFKDVNVGASYNLNTYAMIF